MFRIAGYHTEQTIECLTAGEIENMECTMRKFPSLLASYVDEHKIKMTTLDKLNIYACFINVATISVGYDFENFAFCPGDKALLLRVIQRMSEEITLRITDLSKKKLFPALQFCNPNAQVPTVSTIIGKFYGVPAIDPKGMSIDKYYFVVIICNIFNSNLDSSFSNWLSYISRKTRKNGENGRSSEETTKNIAR